MFITIKNLSSSCSAASPINKAPVRLHSHITIVPPYCVLQISQVCSLLCSIDLLYLLLVFHNQKVWTQVFGLLSLKSWSFSIPFNYYSSILCPSEISSLYFTLFVRSSILFLVFRNQKVWTQVFALLSHSYSFMTRMHLNRLVVTIILSFLTKL